MPRGDHAGQKLAADVGLHIPEALGVWQVATAVGVDPDTFAIMMGDLNDNWEPYNPITSPPNNDELLEIMLEAMKIHVAYFEKVRRAPGRSAFCAAGC